MRSESVEDMPFMRESYGGRGKLYCVFQKVPLHFAEVTIGPLTSLDPLT